MRCSSLGSMAAVGFWVYFLTECISGLGVLNFRYPPFFPTCGYFCGGLLPPAVRPGAPIHILQCRCRCRCRCLCRCRCRFRFRCRCYPCGYFRGGRVKESDGECCSQGGVWARPGPGAGPPAQVRPTGSTRPTGAGPAHQARRRRSGPPVLVPLGSRGVEF